MSDTLMHEPVAYPVAAQVAEIERRMQWRALPVMIFLALMAVLAVTAILSLAGTPRTIDGLPSDPELQELHEQARGRMAIPTAGLRFHSALFGEPSARATATDVAHATRAASVLERARHRHAWDARIDAALGHLLLARGFADRAERRYRAALDRGTHYPEARLALGVALAVRASEASDALLARGYELEAIAQFAAVQPRDRDYYDAALFNRALLLDHVGRHAEARALGRTYLVRDPASPWAERLAEALGIRGDE